MDVIQGLSCQHFTKARLEGVVKTKERLIEYGKLNIGNAIKSMEEAKKIQQAHHFHR